MINFRVPGFERYFLYSTGTTFRPKYFDSKQDALNAMYKYCNKHNIRLEITEDDCFGIKFTDHNGSRFYLNKVRY